MNTHTHYKTIATINMVGRPWGTGPMNFQQVSGQRGVQVDILQQTNNQVFLVYNKSGETTYIYIYIY